MFDQIIKQGRRAAFLNAGDQEADQIGLDNTVRLSVRIITVAGIPGYRRTPLGSLRRSSGRIRRSARK
jgi:hypothetical protein